METPQSSPDIALNGRRRNGDSLGSSVEPNHHQHSRVRSPQPSSSAPTSDEGEGTGDKDDGFVIVDNPVSALSDASLEVTTPELPRERAATAQSSGEESRSLHQVEEEETAFHEGDSAMKEERGGGGGLLRTSTPKYGRLLSSSSTTSTDTFSKASSISGAPDAFMWVATDDKRFVAVINPFLSSADSSGVIHFSSLISLFSQTPILHAVGE